MRYVTRRDLLRWLASGVAGYVALQSLGCGARSGPASSPSSPVPSSTPSSLAVRPTAPPPATGLAELAVVRGEDPAENTRRAVAALGGMERFVRPDQTVLVKPNICHITPGVEYATTTHPDVVGALVSMVIAAGARKVQVMDGPFSGSPAEAYARSGIADAVAAAGGEMVVMSPVAYADTPIPEGRRLKHWSIYQPALEFDVIIDVPVAKHHSLAGLTLAMKNLMGLLNPRGRGRFHGRLHQNIADLTTLFRPTLTVVDATRILMAHGPTGGSLDDVRWTNTVIASPDIVAADAYATTLFDRQPKDIAYIAIAAEMGLGSADLGQMRIEEIAL